MRTGTLWAGTAVAYAVAAFGLRGQTETLPALQVSAAREAAAPADIPVALDLFSAADLDRFPTVTLDDTLRDDPSFSLFRRTSSLTSNPTSQGVSLREIGPSGASRSLVLLDGIPLNDPFGGWVVWSAVPRLTLAQAEVIHGGGSGVWGNSALAGTIQLFSAPASAPGQPVAGAIDTEFGAFDTRSAEVEATADAGKGTVTLDAAGFATDGFYDLAAADRGPVDRPFNSDHRLAELSVREPVGTDIEVVASGRVFDEDRGNGTVLQNNTTHTAVASLAVDGRPSADFSWEAAGYVERESFSAFFSSVNAARTLETPANDQFDVPATAAGAALTARWTGRASTTAIGADFRQVAGESREDFQYSGDAFTKIRFAGGREDFAGLFAHHDRSLGGDWHLTLDARVDSWENTDGHDREYLLAGGAPTLLAAYPTQTGREFSPNAGIVWKPAGPLRGHAALYRGFRVPTLNEYYRPFRVGTVTTNANPDLQPESLEGAEAGLDYTAGAFKAGVTGFADDLYRAVGTVNVSSTPAATTVMRANLDEVQVRGVEASASWAATDDLTLRAAWLFNDSRITAASAEPDLVGLRLPEVPASTVTGSAEYRAPGGIRTVGRMRWVGAQFDDNANTERLPAAVVFDVELSRRFGKVLELYLAAENVGGEAVAASVASPGVFTYDAPRLIRGGARLDW